MAEQVKVVKESYGWSLWTTEPKTKKEIQIGVQIDGAGDNALKEPMFNLDLYK